MVVRPAVRRRACQSTLAQIADTLIRLLAPILPHTADEAWKALYGKDASSVQLEVFAEIDTRADPDWPKVMAVRDAVLKQYDTIIARF